VNSSVKQAIQFIRDQYSEPITLTDLAGSALLSRFHFCRVFRDATGVTPGRFLSAVRIYQAKRMLVTTSMNITDIAFSVGYNSLGSFSNHFTASVGVSPGRFRRFSQHGALELPIRSWDEAGGVVAGVLTLPEGYTGAQVFVGVFDTPIVQCQPAAAAILEIEPLCQSALFDLGRVPEGLWYIDAVGVTDSDDPEPWTRRTMLVGSSGPVAISYAGVHARIALRTRRSTDLPILLALPELESWLSDSLRAEAGLITNSGTVST
jgi:AraC family transcriptional regulator